nr:SDR family oxidoreductase [Marinobacter mobilis]
MDRRVLVTGSSGFIGWALVRSLVAVDGICVRAASRQERACPDAQEVFRSPDLSPGADWRHCLPDVDVVVHTAARVHVMNDSVVDPLAEFRRVNTEGTLALARQAAEAGVRRFIFLSSVKVNGEGTPPGRPFTASDTPAPSDAYGISKREAEDGLRQLALETGMEVTIIRPVLVYGPGVGANFRRLMVWLVRGIPLPLARVNNHRSLVAVDNLVDLIRVCLVHPAAGNRVFMVSDGDDLSTPDLLRRLGGALGHPARLLSVPEKILRWGLRLVGREDLTNRLCGSLLVDISDTCDQLGWAPPVAVDAALRDTAVEFLAEKRGSRGSGDGLEIDG